LTRGWHTDLAVLRYSGSSIDVRGDHIVVRTPANPTFHWGNFVLVTDPDATEDAPRWTDAFEREFPGASHVAIGLPQLPTGEAYAAAGIAVGTDDVLYTATQPEPRPLAHGYTARALTTDDDWEQKIGAAVAENDRTGEYGRDGHELFLRRRGDQHRSLCDADVARFFGAFTGDGRLVSDLGIVDCEGLARYQSVGTDAGHRRKGLAGHLLGVAAQWAAGRGCTEWVIVTETTNEAGRVYRSVGFEPDAVQVSAYRHRTRPGT
jgi:GNAT superfamily N-acetyltransferase